jgi:hypothetical protein
VIKELALSLKLEWRRAVLQIDDVACLRTHSPAVPAVGRHVGRRVATRLRLCLGRRRWGHHPQWLFAFAIDGQFTVSFDVVLADVGTPDQWHCRRPCPRMHRRGRVRSRGPTSNPNRHFCCAQSSDPGAVSCRFVRTGRTGHSSGLRGRVAAWYSPTAYPRRVPQGPSHVGSAGVPWAVLADSHLTSPVGIQRRTTSFPVCAAG